MVTFSWMTDVDTDCWSVPALSSLDVCPSSAIVLHVMNVVVSSVVNRT
jgi:hypothetical protein